MSTKKNTQTYDYYTKNTFWNDHPVVKKYMNSLMTGDEEYHWMQFLFDKYFSNRHGKIKAVSIGCGNAWQDRSLNDIFKFKELQGYDVAPDLIKEAQDNAPSKAFSYDVKDLNSDTLPKQNYYDLAINVAALHHIEDMDHIMREVYKILKPGGIFVHYDYIGPKRNQYSDQDLEYMNWMQELLPEDMVGREQIVRPSIEVMLREDPSEAVGSELIMPYLKNYFSIEWSRFYNGGLLYQVLYNQIQHFDTHNPVHNSLLKIATELEREMTWSGKVRPLFAFVVARKGAPTNTITGKAQRVLESMWRGLQSE